MNDDLANPSDDDFWNYKIIDSPPVVTFYYTPDECKARFSANDFHVLFENHLNNLLKLVDSNQTFFQTEITLLKKLVYKSWNSLRKERAMQSMQKLKRLLNSYEEIKFEELIKKMKDLVTPDQMQISFNKRSLPSREVFEHFTVRIYGVFRLLEYAQSLIRENIFFYLVKSIQIAVFMPNNLLFLGTVSRIYCIIKKYNESIVFVYNCLRQYLHLFKSTNIKWSNKFQIEQLPQRILLNNENENDLNEINLLESKIEQLDLLNLKNNEAVNDLTFNNLQHPNIQDIGVRIERSHGITEPEKSSGSKTSNNSIRFVKWNKILTRYIQKQN